MFDISFTLASQRDTSAALKPIAALLRDELRATRVWIVVGDAIAADTGAPDRAPVKPVVHTVLRRRPGDEPAEWVRVHAPGRTPSPSRIPPNSPTRSRSRRAVEPTVPCGPPGRAAWAPGSRRNPGRGRRRRPDRRLARAGSAPARCDVGRDLPTERCAQVRAAGLRVARPAHAARLHPRRRRHAHGPGGRVAARPASRDRRVDRPGSRVAEPARHEPARHEPGGGW